MPRRPSSLPPELERVASGLRLGETHEVTVGELLGWFGVDRRDPDILDRVKFGLGRAGLLSVPDVEVVPIDGHLVLKRTVSYLARPVLRVPDTTPMMVADSEGFEYQSADHATDLHVPKVGVLMRSGRTLVHCSRQDSVGVAEGRMVVHDYSQLPVLSQGRKVDGIVSWKSIGEARGRGASAEVVADCMDRQPPEVRVSDPLSHAVAVIREHEVTLVRNEENVVDAILTSADIVDHFDAVSGPFLIIRDIETYLKRLVGSRIDRETIVSARDPAVAREVTSVRDLSLGEIARLIDQPEVWVRLRIAVDRRTVVGRLEEVVQIRNAVMHFHPDGAGPKGMETLKQARRMMETLTRGLPEVE